MIKISWKRLLREYPYECVIIIAAIVVSIVALGASILTKEPAQTTKPIHVQSEAIPHPESHVITVDVSGEVVHPDVYRIPANIRLGDLIAMAGGLTSNADSHYIQRNYNMARLLSDQEKLYVPSYDETTRGIFIEEPRALQYLAVSTNNATIPGSDNNLVSINTASATELDSLSGIGQTLAKNIISKRPYKNINELLSKKVLKQAQFEKVKSSISL